MQPVRTAEAREQQLIGLAVDLVEKRLINGTASAQEVTQLLRMGDQKAKLERQELEKKIELLEAKIKAIQSTRMEESFYAEVVKAVKEYQGKNNEQAQVLQ